jgi:hypothetical protein
MVIVTFAVANMERIEKLESILEKRLQDVKGNQLMAGDYEEFIQKYNTARMERLELEKQGNHKRAETHYMSDLLAILVDIYKLEDQVTPAVNMYKSEAN